MAFLLFVKMFKSKYWGPIFDIHVHVAGELPEPRVVRGLRGCVRRGVPPRVQQGPGHRLPQPVPGRLRRGRGHRGVSGALS